MKTKILKVLVLAAFLAVGLACVIPVPQPAPAPEPAPEPTPAPPPDVVLKPAPGKIPMREMAPPDRFTLNFRNAYLIHDPQTGTLQIAAEGNVLSYGGDWEVRKVKPYLFHLRLKTWQHFYWQVNTSRLEAYEIKGDRFGTVLDSTSKTLPFDVDKVGGAGNSEPKSFKVIFPKSHLIYAPQTDVLQLITEGMVMSYCSDWQRCKLHNNVYHFRQNNWAAFFWKVNTISKKVWRVRGGTYCGTGGSDDELNIRVGVTR